MVIDTSAIVAIFGKEPEAVAFVDCIDHADARYLSAASALEATMVLSGRYPAAPSDADRWLDSLLADADIEVIPVSVLQSRLARTAFHRFGKGTGHGAGLNFGDCFSYALAKALDVPLLYKGGDFGRTDIVSALGA